MIVGLLHHHVEPVRHRRDVRVHDPRQQVAVAVDGVGDPDQVVVEVTEVALSLRGHARERHHAACQGGKHVALRRDDPAYRDQRPLHVEELTELLLGGLAEDLVLELVDLVVEPGHLGEVGVDEAVDDHVQQCDLTRRVADHMASREPLADGAERGAVAAVHRHDRLLHEEDVQPEVPAPPSSAPCTTK